MDAASFTDVPMFAEVQKARLVDLEQGQKNAILGGCTHAGRGS
jgi:hypothetical protein